jgi:purine-binding chemotaxis protein CheW
MDGTAGESATRQVLTFALGGEIYGLDILRVKEIRSWSAVTRIPHSPADVLGVLNLRGGIVPIIDLRERLAMPPVEFTAITVVIVLSLRTDQGRRECGIVVDGVRDVVDIVTDSIRPAVEKFIEGFATIDEQMLILLNADDLAAAEQSPAALTTAA